MKEEAYALTLRNLESNYISSNIWIFKICMCHAAVTNDRVTKSGWEKSSQGCKEFVDIHSNYYTIVYIVAPRVKCSEREKRSFKLQKIKRVDFITAG